jgi:hypothetical protein
VSHRNLAAWVNAVVEAYLASAGPSHDRLVQLDRLPRTSVVDDRVRLESIEWLCDLPLRHNERWGARIRLNTRSSVSDVSIVLGLSSLQGSRILSYRSDCQEGSRPSLNRPGSYTVILELESLPVAPSVISLDIACYSGDSHTLDSVSGAVHLEIVPGPTTPTSLFHSLGGVRSTGRWVWDHE